MSAHKKKKKAFVAVHLGAGEHSTGRTEKYKILCDKACSKAMNILRQGGSAGEAVVAATKIIEDSELVNAGRGSNLSLEGTVECDAAFMDGDGYFGGVGAVPGVPNPVLIPKAMADIHRQEKLFSCGRVPPNFLVGELAKTWAAQQSIPTCENSAMISRSANKAFEKNSERLGSAESKVSDTVGAIAIDFEGKVASTVSSGGNMMKIPGRVGHSPIFGCGCWSSNNSETATSAIALSTSGSGEMLSRLRIPQECAAVALSETNNFGLVGSVSTCLNNNFIKNTSLDIHCEPRLIGLIVVSWDGNHGEFVWAHSSKNFVIAYSTSKMRSTKMKFSELSLDSVPGRSLKVEGIVL